MPLGSFNSEGIVTAVSPHISVIDKYVLVPVIFEKLFGLGFGLPFGIRERWVPDLWFLLGSLFCGLVSKLIPRDSRISWDLRDCKSFWLDFLVDLRDPFK